MERDKKRLKTLLCQLPYSALVEVNKSIRIDQQIRINDFVKQYNLECIDFCADRIFSWECVLVYEKSLWFTVSSYDTSISRVIFKDYCFFIGHITTGDNQECEIFSIVKDLLGIELIFNTKITRPKWPSRFTTFVYNLITNKNFYQRQEAYTLLAIHKFCRESVVAWLPRDLIVYLIKNYIL
jgi:hypothetical protein